jgi:hypothetical protein
MHQLKLSVNKIQNKEITSFRNIERQKIDLKMEFLEKMAEFRTY